jgi:hypothetical protein
MSTAATEKTTGPEPMLEFKFPETEAGQVDARTLMRWCAHRPLLTPLEETSYKNPYLVIVVRSHREIYDGVYSDTEWEDTAVYAVKLTAEMHHVYFHRPGKNEIRAFVVDYDDEDTRKWVREQVNLPRLRLSGVHGQIADFRSLFNSKGALRGGDVIPSRVKHFVTDAVAEVDVPDGLFAPPPLGLEEESGVSLLQRKAVRRVRLSQSGHRQLCQGGVFCHPRYRY